MAVIKAAILKCDDVLEKFQDTYGSYPDMISASFNDVDETIVFDTYDSRNFERPEFIAEYQFYVITGSKQSVYDEDPWIKDLTNFINELESNGAKLFGICFGHQLIALSRGCLVQKSKKGWGVGVACNTILKSDVFGADISELNLLVSHQDQVETLSNDAKLIATSSFCKHFLVQWSKNTISVQGHPEWEKGYSKDLMNDRRDRIEGNVIEAGITSLSTDIDNLKFNRSILNFLLDN